MWLIGLGALLTQAPVVVHLQVAENVAEVEAKRIVERFAEASRVASGLEVQVYEGWACGDQEDCAQKLRAQTGASQIVLLRLFGGITTIGLVAELDGRSERASLDIEVSEERSGAIARLVKMFWREPAVRKPPPELPKVQETPPPRAIVEPPKIEESSSVGPWVILGSGLALGAASAVLWATAASSRRSVDDRLAMRNSDGEISGISYSDALDAYSSINLRRNLSLAGLGAASTALAVALVWWLSDG